MSFNYRLPSPDSSIVSSVFPTSNAPHSDRHTSDNLSVASQAQSPASYTLNIQSMDDIQAIVQQSRQKYPYSNLTEKTIYNYLIEYIQRKKIDKSDTLENVLSQWLANISSEIPLTELPNDQTKKYDEFMAEIAQAAKRQRT